ncbi:rab escort protein 1 isoform X2 [Diospyros lotus]|uniref:rab escort protein 1 isoform X2 n=1 Tax=Diospyros lotus TaxID=55363 RepID=UPI002258BADA|nr:rab escort protein 1 isoform X2 [Diospyros lotus]
MEDTSSYPPIDPTNFDIIIVGTGLPESILAAAASAAGKTVLHLDPNPFYGSHFASVPLHEFTSFLQSQSSHHSPPPSATPGGGDHTTADLASRPMYSEVEISSHFAEPLELSRKFNLDLAGPRVLFCADTAVDLILKSGASQYMEFKSVDASFLCGGEGNLLSVPDSRSAIFKDANLGLAEKNRLGRFFKLVEGHLKAAESGDGESGDSSRRIPEEDLESPFVEFLNKMRLPPKTKSIILYAIAMVDYDQDKLEVCKDVLKTRDGINRLALYHSSVGRFPNAPGALLYPIYGQGELPQAFCRRAAVKGCVYVLRMPVNALLMDKDTGSYKGVELASEFLQGTLKDFGPQGVGKKVARGICITNSSLKPDASTFLVVYPPKSLYPEQATSIRVLQIGSSLAVCPSGMFVLYLSALCNDAIEGKKSLHAAVNAMFSVPITGTPESSSSGESENAEVKPTLLWSALYIQEMATSSFGSITSTPMPDANLNYSDLLDTTKELFHRMFPDEEFFPEAAFSEPDDGRLDQSPNSDLVDAGGHNQSPAEESLDSQQQLD